MPAYLLSIEPTGGKSYVDGFHLGTDLKVAKQIAEERFHGRNKMGLWTASVALLSADTRRIVGIFDGEWSRIQG